MSRRRSIEPACGPPGLPRAARDTLPLRPRTVMGALLVPLAAWAAGSTAVPPASASCIATGTVLLWSYPADGARSVPVDATLWAWAQDLTVRRVLLNGARVKHRGVGFGGVRVEPGRLWPNKDYMLVLEGTRHQKPVEIGFRTGIGRSSDPPTATVAGHSTSPGFPTDPLCPGVLGAQDCFDTGQDTLLSFHMKGDEPIAWLLAAQSGYPGATGLWPAGCGEPSVYVHGSRLPGTCYDVRAIGHGGKPGPSVRWCAPLPRREARTTIVPCEPSPSAPPEEPAAILHQPPLLPTELAWKAAVSGVVRLRVTIDEEGAPERVEIVDDLPFGLGRHAAREIRSWRFGPATRDGRAVSSVVCLEAEFPQRPVAGL